MSDQEKHGSNTGGEENGRPREEEIDQILEEKRLIKHDSIIGRSRRRIERDLERGNFER
jgi:hypothetical protein